MKTHRYTVTSIRSHGKLVPCIRLSGTWLAAYGFHPGRKLILYERPGSLLINLILPEDEEG